MLFLFVFFFRFWNFYEINISLSINNERCFVHFGFCCIVWLKTNCSHLQLFAIFIKKRKKMINKWSLVKWNEKKIWVKSTTNMKIIALLLCWSIYSLDLFNNRIICNCSRKYHYDIWLQNFVFFFLNKWDFYLCTDICYLQRHLLHGDVVNTIYLSTR